MHLLKNIQYLSDWLPKLACQIKALLQEHAEHAGTVLLCPMLLLCIIVEFYEMLIYNNYNKISCG